MPGVLAGVKYVGTGLFVIGAVSGVVTGAYFTTKFCNELIDQFTDYYKKNADKIASSYQEAIEYFDDVLK